MTPLQEVTEIIECPHCEKLVRVQLFLNEMGGADEVVAEKWHKEGFVKFLEGIGIDPRDVD